MVTPERNGKPPEFPRHALPVSPEERRRAAVRWHDGLQEAFEQRVGPGTRVFRVLRRVIIGVWDDGFIHAGNLAYMGILALFPFFITMGAMFSALLALNERRKHRAHGDEARK